MKTNKKNPRNQLERFSVTFMQLGLVLVLFIVYISLEYETEQKKPIACTLTHTEKTLEYNFMVPYKKEVLVRKPQKKIEHLKTRISTKVADLSKLKKGDEINPKQELSKSIIDDSVSSEPFDINKVVEVVEPDDFDKDFSFTSVQSKPVFKGCEGLDEQESKKCFDRKINKLVQRYFDPDLASELDLKSGRHRIAAQFVINKNGDVIDVKIRAPHPKLKEETQKVVDKIPKFTPGKQNYKSVNVKYTLPITFYVE